jgi:hypothetical protein
MEIAAVLEVDVSSLSYGYGFLTFSWHDPEYGQRRLCIDAEGWCSREMPIRSGQGPPQFVQVSNHVVRLKLDDNLSKRLELPLDLEMRVNASAEQLQGIHHLISYFDGTY